MQKARELADELGVPADHRFRNLSAVRSPPDGLLQRNGERSCSVVFEQSQLSSATGTSGASLLEIAEHAGLRPKAGCRAGSAMSANVKSVLAESATG